MPGTPLDDQAKEWFEENKRKFRFNIPRIDEGLNLVKKSWNREKLITYFEGVLDWFDPDFEDYMWGRFTRAILEKLHENYYYNYQNIDYYLTDEINKILKNDWIISEDPIKLLFKLYNPNEIIRTIIEFGEPGI